MYVVVPRATLQDFPYELKDVHPIWFDGGPEFTTLAQHQINIGWTPCFLSLPACTATV